MTFLEKQIRPSIRMIKLDTDDNVEAVSQLPATMVKVLNIKDMPKQDGKFVKRITFTRYSNISYDELVNGMVRDKYSESAEFAILRKAMTLKTDEFTEYNAYVEECKVRAKEWINQRDGI
jgi:hypothetical protein